MDGKLKKFINKLPKEKTWKTTMPLGIGSFSYGTYGIDSLIIRVDLTTLTFMQIILNYNLHINIFEKLN